MAKRSSGGSGRRASGSGGAFASAAGLRALRRDLLRLGADAQRMAAADALAGAVLAGAARAAAPFATGELAGSVGVSVGARGPLLRVGARHAVPQEALRPWLWPALRAAEPFWVQPYLRETDRLTGRIRGRTY